MSGGHLTTTNWHSRCSAVWHRFQRAVRSYVFDRRMDQMIHQQPNQLIPVHADALDQPLVNFASSLSGTRPVRIVALGSSSTAGEGGIVPYPYRLEAALRAKHNGRMIDVLNRGKGGEEAPAEVARMPDDVLSENPSLIIWQIGTNAVWQPGHDLKQVEVAIANGLALLDNLHADVILMDLQYAPALLTQDKIDATRYMLSAIDRLAAAGKRVNVFHRFDMMRKWHELEGNSFDRIIDPNDEMRLHQSDWSAQRIGYELGEAIAAAVALAA